MSSVNHIDEAKRLLDIIVETKITKQEDWLFLKSVKARVDIGGFVTEKQIFWLRDIKDRQVDN